MTAISSPARRGRLARMSWLAVLVIGVAAYLLVLRTLVATDNPNFVPSLILLGSIVVPSTVLVYAATGGRRIVVSAGLLAITAILGGVLGTVAAGTLEYDTLRRLGAVPMIMIGLIEEASKLVVPIIVLVVLRRRDRRAGVIIGVASGMGFATLETMGYGFTALLRQRSVVAVEETLLLRALLSPAGHVAWTGLTVAALWAIPGSRTKGKAVLRAVGTFVVAVLLHAAWDGFDSLTVHVVVGGVSFVALMITIRRSHRDEERRSRRSRRPQGGNPSRRNPSRT
ncbi:MAG: PrsW family intramembrane metalloprotease [Propionibacteriaceae bacterium]